MNIGQNGLGGVGRGHDGGTSADSGREVRTVRTEVGSEEVGSGNRDGGWLAGAEVPPDGGARADRPTGGHEATPLPGDASADTRDAGSDAEDVRPAPPDARDVLPDTRDALWGSCVSGGALLPAGSVCRAAGGPCDVVETCDGVSADCPADKLASADTECRASAGECDLSETCSGTAVACPVDRLKPAGTLCRASSDGNACDPTESCTGRSASCPADLAYARPAVPGHVLATPGTLQATLAWDAASLATAYNVKRSTTGGSGFSRLGGSPTTRMLSYTDQGLTADTTYYYVVSSVNTLSTCESADSVPASVTASAPCVPPAAPTVNAVPGDGSVTLDWPAVAGATKYLVLRRASSGSDFAAIGVVLAGTAFTDKRAANGKHYSYVVTASNGRCSSASSAPVSVTPACGPLAAPTGVAATPGKGHIALTWRAPSGAKFFWISRNTTGTGAFAPIGTTTSANYLDRQVVSGVKYYYVVAASNGSCWSADTAVVAATTANSSHVIYDDALRNGWVNWSWNGSYAFDAAAIVRSGAASIGVRFASPWAGLQLHNDTAVSCAGKTAFVFWANGGSAGTRQVRFYVRNAAGVSSRVVLLSVPSGTWNKMTVNLNDLGNPANVKEIVIQETTGAAQPEFNIDQLELVDVD